MVACAFGEWHEQLDVMAQGPISKGGDLILQCGSEDSQICHQPCAACRYLRRKCTEECIFAPYFPQSEKENFVSVHR
jgi:hypothetical protein